MLPQALGPIFVAGFAFGSISIVSIGPNNILLLREGLTGRRPLLVAGVMWGCYAALLGLAVFAGHSIHPSLSHVAWLLEWGGVIALAGMGLLALRAARRSPVVITGGNPISEPWTATLFRVLQVVWLNPLTYLEMLAIPAALALPLASLEQRYALFAGVLSAFALNCFGLALGASLMTPVLGRPSALRVFDGVSGAIMLALAAAAGWSATLRASEGGSSEPVRVKTQQAVMLDLDWPRSVARREPRPGAPRP